MRSHTVRAHTVSGPFLSKLTGGLALCPLAFNRHLAARSEPAANLGGKSWSGRSGRWAGAISAHTQPPTRPSTPRTVAHHTSTSSHPVACAIIRTQRRHKAGLGQCSRD